MNALDLIKLKNGAEEPKASVMSTMMSLNMIWDQSGLKGTLAIYDLGQIARGKGAYVDAETIKLLQSAALVQPDGKLHDTVRNVVLSAVDEEGNLGSPVARPAAAVANTAPKKTLG